MLATDLLRSVRSKEVASVSTLAHGLMNGSSESVMVAGSMYYVACDTAMLELASSDYRNMVERMGRFQSVPRHQTLGPSDRC